MPARRLLGVLPPQAFARLTIRPSVSLVACDSVGALRRTLATLPVDLVVLDPFPHRDDMFGELLKVVRERGLPLLLYGDFEHGTGRVVLDASSTMPVELWHAEADPECRIVRRVLNARGQASVTAMTLHGLSDALQILPPRLIDALIAVIAGSTVIRGVAGLVNVVGADEGSIRSWLRGATLQNPSRLLNCIRVGHAADCLFADGRRVETVARDMQWPARTMRAQFLQLTGAAPSKHHSYMSVRHIAARLVASAMRCSGSGPSLGYLPLPPDIGRSYGKNV
jgi:hypothetical protein